MNDHEQKQSREEREGDGGGGTKTLRRSVLTRGRGALVAERQKRAADRQGVGDQLPKPQGMEAPLRW